jgi:hypothetical protein
VPNTKVESFLQQNLKEKVMFNEIKLFKFLPVKDLGVTSGKNFCLSLNLTVLQTILIFENATENATENLKK